MHWYDHVAILIALLLAWWADYDAGRAMRASLMVFFATLEHGQWMRSAELRALFGPSVYKHIALLLEHRFIEKREAPGGPERGRRPDFFYRRRMP